MTSLEAIQEQLKRFDKKLTLEERREAQLVQELMSNDDDPYGTWAHRFVCMLAQLKAAEKMAMFSEKAIGGFLSLSDLYEFSSALAAYKESTHD